MDLLVDFFLGFSGPALYALIFLVLLACGFGFPLPEDIVLFVGGVLSYYGVTDPWIMIGVCLGGVLIGDSTVFYLGHHFGTAILKRAPMNRIIHAERLAGVRGGFQRRGNKLIFAARFMPGLRAPIFFTAGTMHLPYRVFLAYDGAAALLSVPAIIYSVFYFGDQLERVIGAIRKVEHGILFAIVGVVLVWLVKHHLKKKRESAL